MYAIGVVLGFATVFRITDLHNENILFNDDNLYILDSESCFFRDNSNQVFEPKFTHLINVGFYDKTNFKYGLHLSKNKVAFLQEINFKNPSINLHKNLQYIKDGSNDVIKSVLEKSKILNEIILSMNFYTRIILRPTNAYAIWLSELFKPSRDLEINIKNLSLAMSKFYGINCFVENIGEIVKAELLDLIITDIPFFSIRKNSLYHNENLVAENLYKEPYEKFIKSLLSNLNNVKFDDNIVRKY